MALREGTCERINRSAVGGEERGYDGGKKVKGRKRHILVDAGYRGEHKGADWVRKTLGWSVDLVERPRKPAPEEVLMRWAREWTKEGVSVDWQKLLPPKAFWCCLPRRWVVERTLSHGSRRTGG
jgi:putative transposase